MPKNMFAVRTLPGLRWGSLLRSPGSLPSSGGNREEARGALDPQNPGTTVLGIRPRFSAFMASDLVQF